MANKRQTKKQLRKIAGAIAGKRDRDIPLSLHPLGFEEAVRDLLAVKPPEKQPPKKKRAR